MIWKVLVAVALVLAFLACCVASRMMVRRIEWSIEAGSPPPFTVKRFRWDLARLRKWCKGACYRLVLLALDVSVFFHIRAPWKELREESGRAMDIWGAGQ